MEPRIQYAKTSDGVSIAYATVGSGPAVVWIQNVFQSHVQLAWEQPVLRGGYEAIVASGATLVRLTQGAPAFLTATLRTFHQPPSLTISKRLWISCRLTNSR